jgi:hypothetical protein
VSLLGIVQANLYDPAQTICTRKFREQFALKFYRQTAPRKVNYFLSSGRDGKYVVICPKMKTEPKK